MKTFTSRSTPTAESPRSLITSVSIADNRYKVVEVRNSADAVGLACLRTASKQCFDCGSSLCESHTETCGICNDIFCPSCLSFHSVQHPKAASANHGEVRERRTASTISAEHLDPDERHEVRRK